MLPKLLKSLPIALAYFILSSSQSALAVSISDLSAKTPRGSSSEVNLRFILRAITTEDAGENGEVTTDSVRQLIIANMLVCVDPTTSNCRDTANQKSDFADYRDPNRIPEDDLDQNNEVYFPTDAISLTQLPLETLRYDAEVQLVLRSTNSENSYDENTTIAISFGDSTTNNQSIKPSLSSIVTSELNEISVIGSNQSILVSWDSIGEVEYADNTSDSATGVRAFLIELSQDQFESKVSWNYENVLHKYEDDYSQELDNGSYSCSLSITSVTDRTCSFSCDNAADIGYFRANAFEGLSPTVTSQQTSGSSKNSISFSELSDTTKVYAVFTQILPDGARQGANTSCYLASPSLSFSYAQITGGDTPKKGDPRCFIATAAYGSPLASQIDSLRWFRDQYLMPYKLGKLFVETYYEYSPFFAEKIQDSPILAQITRAALKPIVTMTEQLQNSNEICKKTKKNC